MDESQLKEGLKTILRSSGAFPGLWRSCLTAGLSHIWHQGRAGGTTSDTAHVLTLLAENALHLNTLIKKIFKILILSSQELATHFSLF